MAHYKRKRPRTGANRGGHDRRRHERQPYYNWLCSWPRWWDITFHRRPYRAKEKAVLRRIAKGDADLDDVTFAPAKRPHIYYW